MIKDHKMMKFDDQKGKPKTRVLPIVGLEDGAIGGISLPGFGSAGRNSFEHQNKFLTFEQIMPR